MKIETGRAISPTTARLIHVVGFVLTCAIPTWVFFRLDHDDLADHLGRAVLLVVIAWLVKGLVDGLQRVKEVEITSIVQCLPWRLAAAKKRQR